MWMLLVLLYGVLKGAREIVKKKALIKKTSDVKASWHVPGTGKRNTADVSLNS